MEGEVNDYFGKGFFGGWLIVVLDWDVKFILEENIIIGNVVFYGVIFGEVYIWGIGGERFCVRNFGVNIVVEGIGDYGCEYMIGGLVVVLGEIGKNFVVGMSGGMVYIYNFEGKFEERVNVEMIDLDLFSDEDFEIFCKMVWNYFSYMSSLVVLEILNDWD